MDTPVDENANRVEPTFNTDRPVEKQLLSYLFSIINSMARDVPMIETFKGVIPYFISDIIRVAILIAFPIITLVLPNLLA